MSAETASVEVLTAEVRTLVVGNRQVTLSVYRQLDYADPANMIPFGRVNDQKEGEYATDGQVFTIGRHKGTGALVRSNMKPPHMPPADITDLVRRHRNDGAFEGASIEVDGEPWNLSASYHRVVVCDEDCDHDTTRFGWHFRDEPGLDVIEIASDRIRTLREECGSTIERYDLWRELPLIVLAGLR